ncbi:MAG: glycosyltransferase family 4 protein [Cytophagaceae bacterium]
MKIAIIANTSWNIYNFRLGLAQALIKEGHEVLAISPNDEYSSGFSSSCIQHIPIDIEARGSNPFKDLRLIYRFYAIFKTHKPDLLLQYTIKPNIYGTLAAKFRGIPCINNVSGLGTVFLHDNLTSKIAKALYKLAFSYPHKVFFQNKEDQKLFINMGLVNEFRTGLVPGSGINLIKFKPVLTNKKNPQQEFVFITVARLLYDKGIKEYAEAAEVLKNEGIKARFQILGALDKNPSLGIPEEWINKWQKKGIIEYLGFCDQVIEYMAKADCVVLASYREGTPKSLLEALALGKPVIATDVPGCKDTVVNGVNGYICKAKDPADLADKMKKMISLDESDHWNMGLESRKLAEEKFDEKIVIQKYLEEIKNI